MFISIEGIEGTGKTTVVSALAKLLGKEVSVLQTREPGGTKVAEAIRQILLQDFTGEVVLPKVELLLMFASRLQHVETIIKPALAQGQTVLCDRFVDASYAYQGGGRNINYEKIAMLHNWTIDGLVPDKTILLDMEPKAAFERVVKRNNIQDRIEQENLQFFTRIREQYLFMAKKYPNRFLVVDASLSEEQVLEIIWNEVKTWI